jgi:hypothetical protein
MHCDMLLRGYILGCAFGLRTISQSNHPISYNVLLIVDCGCSRK